MGNMTSWNGGVLTKSTLGSYVHDAKEMEFSLYTLQQACESLKEKIASMKKNYPSEFIKYPHMESEIKPTKTLIPYRTATSEEEENYVRKYRIENEYEYWGQDKALKGFSFREFFLRMSYTWLGMILSIGIAILLSFMLGDSEGAYVFVLLVGGGGCIASGIIAKRKSLKKKEEKNAAIDDRVIRQFRQEVQNYNDDVKRKNEAEERRYKAECERAEVENPRIRERNLQRKKDYEAACKRENTPHNRKIAILRDQLKEMENAIARMTQQREQFYSANLIPVDYRTIDCVFMLDQIFRNDLADTMREAIAKYEERVYRGEVIQGISAIISRLDSLTGLMGDLGRQLGAIQTQVSFMSNDLYDMAERQSQAQNQIIEETRLRRYATEELNKNAERIVKYCDTGRTY